MVNVWLSGRRRAPHGGLVRTRSGMSHRSGRRRRRRKPRLSSVPPRRYRARLACNGAGRRNWFSSPLCSALTSRQERNKSCVFSLLVQSGSSPPLLCPLRRLMPNRDTPTLSAAPTLLTRAASRASSPTTQAVRLIATFSSRDGNLFGHLRRLTRCGRSGCDSTFSLSQPACRSASSTVS